MANYYKERMEMFKALDEMLKNNLNGVDIENLLYNLTSAFEVSEKAILRRIDNMINLNIVTKKDGIVKWNLTQK